MFSPVSLRFLAGWNVAFSFFMNHLRKVLWNCLVKPQNVWKNNLLCYQVHVRFKPIQDGPFRGCSRKGRERGQKDPLSLQFITHILQWWNKLSIVVPYLRKIQKLNESCDSPLHFCWHQHFFNGNQQIFLHQQTEI